MVRIVLPKEITLSFSRIKTWRRCEMQHHYRYVQKLRKRKKEVPLLIGSAIHLMIESYLENGEWIPAFELFKEEFQDLYEEDPDTVDMVYSIMDGYFKYYKNDGMYYKKRRRNRCTEIKVATNITPEIKFVGIVDAMPEDEKGNLWVMDHKSFKSLPDENQRLSDLQLLLYVYLLPQLGYPKPYGVIWNYIRKKAPVIPEILKSGEISRSKSIDTTYSRYKSTVIKELGKAAWVNYKEFAETLKGKESKFYRRIFLPHPPQKLIDNVVSDIIKTGENIINNPEGAVRNFTKDCSWCSYFSLCQTEVRGLDSNFIKKTEYITTGEKDAKEEDPE